VFGTPKKGDRTFSSSHSTLPVRARALVIGNLSRFLPGLLEEYLIFPKIFLGVKSCIFPQKGEILPKKLNNHLQTRHQNGAEQMIFLMKP
jgi:hypothetical protein